MHEPDVDSLAAAFARLSEPAAVAARPEPDRGAARWSDVPRVAVGLVERLT